MEYRLAIDTDRTALTELAYAAGWEVISYPDEWDARLGDGTGTWAGFTVVAQPGDGSPAVGFLWADNAMRVDQGMPVRWLCINALYVHPPNRGEGVGAGLVQAALAVGVGLGMDIVHGQCLPGVRDWWLDLGFEVTEVDGKWHTPLTVDGKAFVISSEGNCPFWCVVTEGYSQSLTSSTD